MYSTDLMQHCDCERDHLQVITHKWNSAQKSISKPCNSLKVVYYKVVVKRTALVLKVGAY